MKNKKGWVKILEAFIAIVLLVAIVSTILVKDAVKKNELANEIYEVENSVLQEVQINNTLRSSILEVEGEGYSYDPDFPEETGSFLQTITPSGLNCTLIFCNANVGCNLAEDRLPEENQDIYVQSTIIGANQDTYNPKKISIFCWKD